MNGSTLRRPLSALLLAASTLTLPALLVSCDSASKVEIPANASPSDLMGGYLGKLGDLNGVLAGVDSSAEAAAAAPKVKDLVGAMSPYAEKITGLPASQLNPLLSQYGPQIDSLTGTLDSQIARLTSGSSYGSALSGLLNNVPRLK